MWTTVPGFHGNLHEESAIQILPIRMAVVQSIPLLFGVTLGGSVFKLKEPPGKAEVWSSLEQPAPHTTLYCDKPNDHRIRSSDSNLLPVKTYREKEEE